MNQRRSSAPKETNRQRADPRQAIATNGERNTARADKREIRSERLPKLRVISNRFNPSPDTAETNRIVSKLRTTRSPRKI